MPRYASEPSLSNSSRSAGRRLRNAVSSAAMMTLLGWGSVASAQSQQEIAEQLNDEGKALMVKQDPAEASKRFTEAAKRSPNPRYFYNLCKAYHFQGLFFQAIDACNSARKNGPDEGLTVKINELEKLVREAAKEQNIDLDNPPTQPDPDNPENPDTPNPQNPDTPQNPTVPVRGVPPKGIYTVMAPRHEYVWTLGADLMFGSSNLGYGGTHEDSFFGVRLRVDYMLLKALQVGAQGYLDFLEITDSNDSEIKTSVSNFGGAIYKHLCFNRICLTPLVGVQLGALDNASLGENEFETFAFGARAEIGASFALGTKFEHVIGLQLGAMAYSTPGDSDELMYEEGGTLPYLSLGYTYRFDTPFGSAPILGLE